MTAEKWVEEGILALLPAYDNGNTAEIYTKKGVYPIGKSVRSCLRNLYCQFSIDEKATREKYEKLLTIRKNIPRVLREDIILIGLKYRIPIGRNDGAYCYVNAYEIREHVNNTIVLTTGEHLSTLSSEKAIRQNRHLAAVIQLDFQKRRRWDLAKKVGSYELQRAVAVVVDILTRRD